MDDKVNLSEKIGLLDKVYSPGIVGYLNDLKLQVVRVRGPFGGNIPLARLAAVIERVRAAARDAGRDPDAVPIVARGVVSVRDQPMGPGGATVRLAGGGP
jgi:hypothetical protein